MPEEYTESRRSTSALIYDLSEGNFWASWVILWLLEEATLRSSVHVDRLERIGIRGPQIWTFYKEICSENIKTMVVLLLATKLCLLSPETLLAAIDSHDTDFDANAVIVAVREYFEEREHLE